GTSSLPRRDCLKASMALSSSPIVSTELAALASTVIFPLLDRCPLERAQLPVVVATTVHTPVRTFIGETTQTRGTQARRPWRPDGARTRVERLRAERPACPRRDLGPVREGELGE